MTDDDDWPKSASTMNEECGVHQYKAFWNRQTCVAQGRTSAEAQSNAAAIFMSRNPRRKIRDWQVAVLRADLPVDPSSL